MTIFTAYVPNRQIPALTERHLRTFDRVNLAFAVLVDGHVSLENLSHIERVPELRAINPDLEILVSVGGGGADGYSEMASTPEGRQQFATECLEVIQTHNLDGMDLDWEFPGSSHNGEPHPEDRQNFTALLETLRKTLDLGDRRYRLTIAAACGDWFTDVIDVADIHPFLDQIMMMTYDLRGFGQTVTGHHSALYTRPDDVVDMSVDQAAQSWLSLGVPPEKLAIGAAFYARMWTEVTDDHNGLLQPGSGGGYGENYDVLRDTLIGHSGYVRHWDDIAKVPWLFDGSTFITYDDEASVREKAKYVKAHQLGGIFFWRYLDDPDNELIPAIAEEIRTD